MDMDQLPYGLRCELLDAYGTWVTDYMDQGHDGYLTTFMFDYIPENSKFKKFNSSMIQ